MLFLLLLMLPLLILFFLPGGSFAGAAWFWVLALLTILLLWSMLGRPRDEDLGSQPTARTLKVDEHPDFVRRHMKVDEAKELPPGVRVFRGTLRDDAQQAYADLKQQLEPGTVPFLQPSSGGRTALILLPRPVDARSANGCVPGKKMDAMVRPTPAPAARE